MKILSIDGGGYLGLATASFIAEIERHFKELRFAVSFAKDFDLYCGTSTGAILSLGLAKGLSGSQLVDLYERLGEPVFGRWSKGRNLLRSTRSIFWSKHSADRLRRELEDAFGNTTLDELHVQGKRVMITAFCVTSGKTRIFKTKNSSRQSQQGKLKLSEIALASAAAPTYFPLVELQDPEMKSIERFCDGGVSANHPSLLGFAEAVFEFRAPPESIKILSLSTPRVSLAENNSGTLRRGLIQWAPKLASILIDSNADLTDQVMYRLVGAFDENKAPVYRRIDFENRHEWPIDRADKLATNSHIHLGENKASSPNEREKVEDVVGPLKRMDDLSPERPDRDLVDQ